MDIDGRLLAFALIAEFEEHFGIKTDPASLGMTFYRRPSGFSCGPLGGCEITEALAEYVFIDESLTCETPSEVAELWRMFRL